MEKGRYTWTDKFKAFSTEKIDNSPLNIIKPLLIYRPAGSDNLNNVRSYIESFFSNLDIWKKEYDDFFAKTPIGQVKMRNLIFTATLPCNNKKQPKRLVLAAHIDSLYKDIKGKEGYVGAVDAGFSVACLLSLARTFEERILNSSNCKQSSCTEDIGAFQFVFLDGEEAFVNWSSSDSLYGSRHLARVWADNNGLDKQNQLHNIDGIGLFVLLDLIGSADGRVWPYRFEYEHYFKELVQIEDKIFGKNNTNRFFLLKSSNPSHKQDEFHIDDDHIPFLSEFSKLKTDSKSRLNVLHLIPIPFPKAWHNIKLDTAENLDSEAMNHFYKVLEIWVLERKCGCK